MSSGNILGENCGTKAIGGIIGTLDSFRLRLELVDANERSEDLLLADYVIILGSLVKTMAIKIVESILP